MTDTEDTGKLAGRDSIVAQNLKSVICIPLRKANIQERTKEDTKSDGADLQGVLYLDSHFLSGKLSSVNHDILKTIANGAATLVENAALVQAEDAAKRYRQELSIAADIQQRLMSVTIPDVPYAKVNAVSYACKDIGGDFFDLVYTEEALSLIVADVSGKGVAAAVVASILQGMLYSQLAQDGFAAGDDFRGQPLPVRKSGRTEICHAGGGAAAADGEMELINCGHVPPLMISGGKVQKVEAGNLPVGLIANAEFTATRLHLAPGDRLALVTDGVTEAEDATGEFFGNERLERCCGDGFAAIEEAVTDFRGQTPLSDDCTITELTYRG